MALLRGAVELAPCSGRSSRTPRPPRRMRAEAKQLLERALPAIPAAPASAGRPRSAGRDRRHQGDAPQQPVCRSARSASTWSSTKTPCGPTRPSSTAIRTTPEVLDAYVQLAGVYRRLERPAEARASVEQAKIALARMKTDTGLRGDDELQSQAMGRGVGVDGRTCMRRAPDTEHPGPTGPRKHACLVRLRDMGQRQFELIEAGNMTALLDLLSAKQSPLVGPAADRAGVGPVSRSGSGPPRVAFAARPRPVLRPRRSKSASVSCRRDRRPGEAERGGPDRRPRRDVGQAAPRGRTAPARPAARTPAVAPWEATPGRSFL